MRLALQNVQTGLEEDCERKRGATSSEMNDDEAFIGRLRTREDSVGITIEVPPHLNGRNASLDIRKGPLGSD